MLLMIMQEAESGASRPGSLCMHQHGIVGRRTDHRQGHSRHHGQHVCRWTQVDNIRQFSTDVTCSMASCIMRVQTP